MMMLMMRERVGFVVAIVGGERLLLLLLLGQTLLLRRLSGRIFRPTGGSKGSGGSRSEGKFLRSVNRRRDFSTAAAAAAAAAAFVVIVVVVVTRASRRSLLFLFLLILVAVSSAAAASADAAGSEPRWFLPSFLQTSQFRDGVQFAVDDQALREKSRKWNIEKKKKQIYTYGREIRILNESIQMRIYTEAHADVGIEESEK